MNVGVGNKFQVELDYVGAGSYPLTLSRVYNSGGSAVIAHVGANWRLSLDRFVSVNVSGATSIASVQRSDGKVFTFSLVGELWTPDADVSDKLVLLTDAGGDPTGWQFTVAATEEVETYDAQGRLVSISSRAGLTQTLSYDTGARLNAVTDPFGRTLTFDYDTVGRVATMTDPAGGVYTYSYDTNNNLVSVSYPDNTPSNPNDNPKRIFYENSGPIESTEPPLSGSWEPILFRYMFFIALESFTTAKLRQPYRFP